jgi:hypothetical protein
VSASIQLLTPSLALEELVQLLDPGTSVPRWLFPGGANTTTLIRLGQIAFGCAQMLACALRGEPVALVHGEGLAFLNGWVEVTVQPDWRQVKALTWQRQPFLAVAASSDGLTNAFAELGLDPDSRLLAFIGGNGCPTIRGKRHGRPCLVHYGKSPDSRMAVMRQAKGLAGAQERLGAVLSGLLAMIYHKQFARDSALLVQQAWSGATAPIPLLSQR